MKKKLFPLVFLMATIVAFGQSDTISTNLSNTNSGASVSFEVTATSATSILGISNLWHTSATTSEVWIRTGGVGGTAGGSLVVNAANGWTLHQTFNVVGLSTSEVWLSNLNPISIPAGTTIGVVITGNMYYNGLGTTPISPNSFTGNFATIHAGGATNGFGGANTPPTAMSFTPRGFIGSVALGQPNSGCTPPTNLAAPTSTIACDKIDVTWTSATGSLDSKLIWDVTGFDPTLGGNVISGAQSPHNIAGLAPGTTYDIYALDSCSSGLSTSVMLTTTTLPLATAAFTQTQTSTTSTDAVVTFDATASTGYTSVKWEFGDGTPDGTNVVENHTYAQNQTYNVTLTLTNACGDKDSTFMVNVNGIGIEETALSRTLNIFPNPTNGAFTIAFELEKSTDVTINILDAYGRLINVKELGHLNGEQNIGVDLEGNASGMYFVLIQTDHGTISRRITLGNN